MLLLVFEGIDGKSEMKNDLLETLRAIFALDPTSEGLSFFGQLEPFKVFFKEFDGLTMVNKKSILKLLDEVITRGELLLPTELKAYCQLLQVRKWPLIMTNRGLLPVLYYWWQCT